MFRSQPAKLHDCQVHGSGSGAELFVVEGDSASMAVARARDARFQAVLPMQGKPLNALKASKRTLSKHAWFAAFIDSVGTDCGDYFHLDAIRYDRIVLLFDPDADGIHCGALMMMFFYRWMRPLLEHDRVGVVRAPMFEITARRYTDSILAYSETHYRKLREQLDQQGIEGIQVNRFRGLASLNETMLRETCIDPFTRSLAPIDVSDAETAIRLFGG
ncbi:toprim domain-containing protein [Novipirellula artificiosorum]|uniref:DNA topoisomerase (ATP-hydrolyzing) n=1 Tax=Novipirellula artificiosorum TaxID=2528016 RepID=A0A5C6D4L7_9BACT|nr:toprim domain-containing protein [Novipirellula artificiosorum]TWU31718.1 DNA topoisomerase 4 subunit B [Novipirellula artificiosorum]